MAEKYFFYDTETTGVKHWKNGIHQISGAIVIDGEIKEKFNYKVCPNPACIIEDEALAISSVTREQVLAYFDMKIVYLSIIQMLGKYVDKFKKTDKFHLVGYNNASFDNAFFRAWFVQNGDQYFGSWFWSDSLDVMVLSSRHLRDVRHTMPSFKQSEVAKQLGIIVDESRLHDAEYDVDILMQIFNKVI